MSNLVSSSSSTPAPPTSPHDINIEWSIARVDDIQDVPLSPTGSAVFPLHSAQPRGVSPTQGSIASTATPPPPRVYNHDDSIHYTALLTSLSQAKDALNARLTEWKEVIGDKEKHKEVLPPGTAGKQGMGKAMMMVQAAKQTDGRAAEVTQRQTSQQVGSEVSIKEQGVAGLPTDDQESDEDEDVELVIPE